MPRDNSEDLRAAIDAATLASQSETRARLRREADLTEADRAAISARGADLVSRIRDASDPGLMEVFLAEYGLSTDEGVALMCLAEALLRVPDTATIDALIEDKIAPSDWGRHLGHSASPLVNASTWALMLTGKVLSDAPPGPVGHLRGAVKRLGEPVIRAAVARAMKEMGRQFVLGEDIDAAMTRARGMEAKGYTYSYDMLGEAARTDAQARAFHLSYSTAISAIARAATRATVAANPGISVKLSALHPRYEEAQRGRVMDELVPRLRSLAHLAASAGIGLNIDAEEADRLQLSLDVIDATLNDPGLSGWDGFGVVVQAYGPRCGPVIDWLHETSRRLDRRLMVRLVKGAYWDAEIKRAQVLGLKGFPVFTNKSATDISYIANARKLLGMTDRLYPQFATHNAHTAAAILHMGAGLPRGTFEFQRLHGMGETLHDLLLSDTSCRCRIYAPVGAHEDLLAYLVRRLLENGANSSFVNQIVDEDVPATEVARDPFAAPDAASPVPAGPDLFAPGRRNSRGWDLTDRPTLAAIDADRPRGRTWSAHPLSPSVREAEASAAPSPVTNPATPGDTVGTVTPASPEIVAATVGAIAPWDASAADRAKVLRQAADAYETAAPEVFALLAREAGKSLPDAVGELREAVDFLRFYAAEAERLEPAPSGTWAAISPWNFPLAIFTGQVAAALAAGNGVVAKPAPQTPLIAAFAVEMLHNAGVPRTALALVPGGAEVGAALTARPDLCGVVFTGSTATAKAIRQSLADHAAPGTPLIAETGGLNAMIVDSTALPEHAVRDIVASAFQSAGQRCSALRCLYVQEDIADRLTDMLSGAMDELQIGDPWHLSTDIGPVIDGAARDTIAAHIDTARAKGRVLHELTPPMQGTFIAPTLIAVDGIADLEREVFGPVLHIATYKADEIDEVIAAINATGYGLTFGLHTRIDDRVQHVLDRVHAGNTYVNRNQIGAVVGSQPFGGEGLSGTGPKAGGPHYLPRFSKVAAAPRGTQWPHDADTQALSRRLANARTGAPLPPPVDLPGPTGEANRLSMSPRGPVLCLGPSDATAQAQVKSVENHGGLAVASDGHLDPSALETLGPLSAVLWWGDDHAGKAYEQALSRRAGAIVPLITAKPDAAHVLHERHVCIDTTAAGGNATLLAEAAQSGA